MAISDKSKKIMLWSTIVAVIGIGSYYGYQFFKTRKADKDDLVDDEHKADDEDKPNPNSSNPDEGSTENLDSPADAPFSSPEQIKAFQKWVWDVKKDKSLATSKVPNGQDGMWGKKSAKAWSKYSVEYTKATGVVSSVPDAEFEKAKNILINLWKGDKAKFTTRLNNSNRNFVKMWSKEATTNNATGTNKSNAFMFANQIYDISYGKRRYKSNPIIKGQAYGVTNDFKFRKTASKTADYNTSYNQKDKPVGKVTWYKWNEKEEILFFFIPETADGYSRINKYTASFNVYFK